MQVNFNEKPHFLVTTALTEYIPADKPLLFLSQSCLRHSWLKKHPGLEYNVLTDPWKEKHALLAAREYVEEVYNRLLPELAATLNAIHQTTFSERYWEILIGPWVRIYVAVLYDRYTSLRLAYATYVSLQTISLTQSSYAIADTPHDFSSFLLTDIFNLQLYSYILDYFNVETQKIEANVRAQLKSPARKIRFRDQLKNLLRRISNQLFLRAGADNKILFADSGVSFKTLLKLYFKSGFRIIPMTYFDTSAVHYEPDWQQRRQFLKITMAKADFEHCLIQSLPYFIPAAFIETHAHYCALANRIQFKPILIFSAMGWHYNEPFKRLAAKQQEKGTLLAGHQHGGDYGILDYHASELHEVKVTDRYYTWGWDSQAEELDLKPFYGLKLRETRHRAGSAEQEHYLYGTANGRRYLLRFNYSITSILEYFAFQRAFILALPTYLQQKLRIRLYPSDWGWDRDLRWQEMNVKLHFQSERVPFARALSESKLYIADHISTTFIESLAINKPTLITCDTRMWGIREEALPYFAEMEQAGLLYHDPVAAANALIQIDYNVADWWHDNERQKVIQKFRERFCRMASVELEEWVQELKSVESNTD